jgi:hypothetical protein
MILPTMILPASFEEPSGVGRLESNHQPNRLKVVRNRTGSLHHGPCGDRLYYVELKQST